jgi:hypothetical protein
MVGLHYLCFECLGVEVLVLIETSALATDVLDDLCAGDVIPALQVAKVGVLLDADARLAFILVVEGVQRMLQECNIIIEISPTDFLHWIRGQFLKEVDGLGIIHHSSIGEYCFNSIQEC